MKSSSVQQVVSSGAHIEQLQDEVGILDEDDRWQLFLQSKPLQVQIPVDEGLAMKADLGILGMRCHLSEGYIK